MSYWLNLNAAYFVPAWLAIGYSGSTEYAAKGAWNCCFDNDYRRSRGALGPPIEQPGCQERGSTAVLM
jgi:hypothetical protein